MHPMLVAMEIGGVSGSEIVGIGFIVLFLLASRPVMRRFL